MEWRLGKRWWPFLSLCPISEAHAFAKASVQLVGSQECWRPAACAGGATSLRTLPPPARDSHQQPQQPWPISLPKYVTMDWMLSPCSACPTLHTLSCEVGRWHLQWLGRDRQFPGHIARPPGRAPGEEAPSLGSGCLAQMSALLPCLLLAEGLVLLPLQRPTAGHGRLAPEGRALTACSRSRRGLWCPGLCQLQEK